MHKQKTYKIKNTIRQVNSKNCYIEFTYLDSKNKPRKIWGNLDELLK
ncbi:hypothetical protein [Romboutsia sp. 1001713B170131_170501_G6]|nr:hypothetical protein [Romboutsia sp. 1001713B170131_170501_G6]